MIIRLMDNFYVNKLENFNEMDITFLKLRKAQNLNIKTAIKE